MSYKYPKVKKRVVDGINVVNVKINSLKSFVAVVPKSGSFIEGIGEEGYSHFLEHMLFKGTKNRTYEDVTEQAALIGAYQNAYTDYYKVVYHLDPLEEYTDKAIELLLDMFFNSTLEEDAIEKEKGVVLSEINMYEDDPRSDFYYKFSKDLFDYQVGHPILGYPENIKNISREKLVDFKIRSCGRSNLYLVVAGPWKWGKIEKAIKKCSSYYENFRDFVDYPDTVDKILKEDAKSITFTRSDIKQSIVEGLLEGPGIEDYTFAQKLAVNSFGSGMYSVLFREIRDKRSLCYSVGASSLLSNDKTRVLSVYTSTEKSEEAKQAILECIDRTIKEGIPEKTFECAKASMLSSLAERLENPTSISSLIMNQVIYNMEIDIQKDAEILKNTTLSEVNEAFQSLFEGKDLIWAKLEPKN